MPKFLVWIYSQPRTPTFPEDLPDFVSAEELKKANANRRNTRVG